MSKDKGKLEEAMRKGAHADKLLEDPIIVEVLAKMKDTVYHNFMTSKFDARGEREDLYKQMQTINRFETELRVLMKGGRDARTLWEKLFK